MRLTPFAIFNQLTQSLDRTLELYNKANARLATGKRILAPSDDVNGMMRAMDYRVSITENEQYKRNVDFATSSLKVTDTTLTSVSNTLNELKRLTTLSISGSDDDAHRASMARTAEQMRDNLYTLANSKYMNQYLFAGFSSDQPAYTVTAPIAGMGVATVDNAAWAGVTAASVTVPAALTGDEYRIGFDATAGTYTVYNNASDEIVVPATAYNAGGTAVALPGMSITIVGPIADTDTFIVRPPLPTYAYQGDSGAINVQIDRGASLPVNITGDKAFSYTLAAPASVQISGNRFVHYTPGAGTTIDVQIRASDDVTVLDSFSYANVMQMGTILTSAITTNNALRIEAMQDPFTRMQTQLSTMRADIGARQVRLSDQDTVLVQGTNTLMNALGELENADSYETVAELKKTEISLQSLREYASKVLSQSLLDFLR